MRRPLIFICHSSKDKPFVRDLAARLRLDGVDTWIDELEIRIGDSIHQKINDGLSQSDFLAVVLSIASVGSPWVREELNSASALEKLKARGVFILPLLLEPCNVPPLLLDRRYANFTEDFDSAYRELLEGVYFHFKEDHPDVAVPDVAPPTIDASLCVAVVNDPAALYALSPRSFEELVFHVFRRLGFETTLTNATRDGGIDVIAAKSQVTGLAPVRSLIQCKRYGPGTKVGVSIVRELIGVLHMVGAERGVIVTSSEFTSDARRAAGGGRIDLVDGRAFSELIRGMLSGSPT